MTGFAEHSYYREDLVNADIKQSIEGFLQDDSRRYRVTTNELPNIWKMSNHKRRKAMAKTFEEVRSCIRTKVRRFSSIGKEVSDNQIGALTIKELHISQHANMPGITPADRLAKNIRECVDIDVELSGDKLIKNETWTVDKIAKFIFGQIQE